VLALALAPVAVPVRAEAPAWTPVDAATGRLSSVAELEALATQFPDSGSVRLRLLNAYLEAEQPTEALREAVELVWRGHVFSARAQEMLMSLEPTELQRGTLDLQVVLATPLERSRVLATVPADVHLVESVWRDPRSGDLFVTSVVSRSLHVRRGEGGWQRIPIDGAGSLSGMAFDAAAGLLWISSGVFDQTPNPATAFRGVIAIDPATGEEKRRLAAPEGGSPSDLAVAADGTLYASDPFSGAIYVGRTSGLGILVAPGQLRSPQGIVALPGSSRIVVSDYAYGLALIDAGTGAVRRLATETPLRLDGIDGLWLHGDALVGVHNGSRPMAIVELLLSPDHTRVVAGFNRERAHSEWTEPVGGSLFADELVYVATGQWDRFTDGGAPSAERPPVPTEIRVLELPLVE